MKYLKCEKAGEKHDLPDCSFDWAYPIQWIIHVQQVLGDAYRPMDGHIVWRYGPDDGVCGRPVALCPEAKEVLDEYFRRVIRRDVIEQV